MLHRKIKSVLKFCLSFLKGGAKNKKSREMRDAQERINILTEMANKPYIILP